MLIPYKDNKLKNQKQIIFVIFATKQTDMTEIESGRVHPTKVLAEEIAKKEEFVAPGSLILKPVNVKEPQLRAKVLCVGTGTPTVPIGVSVGETIIFKPMSAQKFVLDERELLLVDTRDILYILPA